MSASARTLDRAFKESIGLSPRACIKTVRLNGVHKGLRKGPLTSLMRPPRVRTAPSLLLSHATPHIGHNAIGLRSFGRSPSRRP